MVSFNVYKPTTSGAYVEGVCLAADTMPTAGIANGSVLYAVDTSDGSMTKYIYNQSGAAWVALAEAEAAYITAPDSASNGDVLTYSDGSWTAAAPSGFIPLPASPSEGDILTYESGAWVAKTPSA